MMGVKHGDPDVSCVVSTTKTDTIGGQVVPWCETHNYPCSPTLMLCLFGAGEAERKRRRVLHCPHCGAQHIDKGKWATFAHPKHRCEKCEEFFEDPLGPSIGVEAGPA